VVFLVLVKLLGNLMKRKDEPPAPASKTCPECLENVPVAAKRCRFCTSKFEDA
jgi:large conductance mechanosensitive channel